MEILAPVARAGKELFEYNRDYFTFDQKQRLDREMLRLELQIKRFELFRDDIRDLVELTTSKMEMYHMVGALMLEFVVAIYTEGAEMAWISSAPPFLKAAYALSLASAFTYILLAVWLSMHASVSAHSFGVRLLTRFVRLPIPGSKQVNSLASRLSDFERQRAQDVMRIPFVTRDAQQWKQTGTKGVPGADDRGDGDLRYKITAGGARGQDLLGTGETALNDGDLTDAASKLPGHHVQLFRRLQAKWQCYDCYARVCMSLGAYHLLSSICYYLIICTIIKYSSITVCFAVITVFTVFNIMMGILDIGRKLMYAVASLHAFGAIPIYMAAASVVSTIHENTVESRTYPYPYSPVIFFLAVLWHQGMLSLAAPSRDGMSLPRRFRTVLFIDVFAVADEALKTSLDDQDQYGQSYRRGGSMGSMDSAETTASCWFKGMHSKDSGKSDGNGGMPLYNLEEIMGTDGYDVDDVVRAEEALFASEAALRRWKAVPPGIAEGRKIAAELTKLWKQYVVSRKLLNGEAARIAGRLGDQAAIEMLHVDHRNWNELTEEEHDEDPFVNWVLGPFEETSEGGGQYYYDLESQEFVWDISGKDILTLAEVQDLVHTAEGLVRSVLGDSSADDGALGGKSSRKRRGSGGLRARLGFRGGGGGGGGGRTPAAIGRPASASAEDDESEDTETDRPTHLPSARKLRQAAAASMGPYVPQRLPWKVVNGMTRFLQLSWLFCGVMFAWQQVVEEVKRLDKYLIAEERRLAAFSDDWSLSLVESKLPQNLLFRPVGLSCHEGASRRYLVSTEDGSSYWMWDSSVDAAAAAAAAAAASSQQPPRRQNNTEEVELASWALHGTSLVCTAGTLATADDAASDRSLSSSASCLLAHLDESGRTLSLQPSGPNADQALDLRIDSPRPWRSFAAALVDCAAVQGLLASDSWESEVSLCLLVAGWDGSDLPIAAFPLRQGLKELAQQSRSSGAAVLSPVMDAPISRSFVDSSLRPKAEEAITALHLDALTGRLWAVLGDGKVEAWELFGDPLSLGTWRPQWPASKGGKQRGQRVVAVCEDSSSSSSASSLMMLVETSTAHHDLWRAELPTAMGSL